MKISFIGFGNMAKAIVQSLRHKKEFEIHAASSSLEISQYENFYTTRDNLEAVKNAQIIVLSVKPTQINELLLQIGSTLPRNSLLISIAAGISLRTLQKNCSPQQAIVRAMPNINIQVEKGITPLIANNQVTSKQKEWASHLFEASGIIHWEEDESKLNVFTALTGSGPAYVFLFLQSLIESAERLGLDKCLAKKLTLNLVEGAVNLASSSQMSLPELIEKVASKKGTTESAILSFQKDGFSQIIHHAVEAAFERAKEIEHS